jgi:hypothetical protein
MKGYAEVEVGLSKGAFFPLMEKERVSLYSSVSSKA